jgi:dolichol kinase
MLPAPTTDELTLLVRRTKGLQPWRRGFHAASGLVVALVPGALGWSPPVVVATLAAALVLLGAIDLARLRSPALNAWFFRSVPSLASPREAAGVASSTWFAAGVLLTWALFAPAAAIPAILVLALADPAASVVGRLVRSPRVGTGSWAGSLAFFSVAVAVLLTTAGVGPAAAVAVAAVASAVEVAPLRLDDNLTVPLSVAALLALAGS